MTRPALPRLTLIVCCFSMTACAPFKYNDDRAAICNQLNSKIVFNGGTSNTRNSEIQSAESSLDQRSYDNYDCWQSSSSQKRS